MLLGRELYEKSEHKPQGCLSRFLELNSWVNC